MTKHDAASAFAVECQTAITVVQLTDPHLFADQNNTLLNINTHTSLQGVLKHLIKEQANIDLLLVTGDITQDGSEAAYRRFLKMAATVPAPLACLPGNHDDHHTIHQTLPRQLKPVIDIGNWRLILLDTSVAGSNAGKLSDDQIELLRTSVHQAGKRHVVLALHHNPVPVGSPWLDTMMIANAKQLFQLLQESPKIKAVIWGHVHQEYDAVHKFSGTQEHEVRLLAAPSTCVQFTPDSTKFSLDSSAPGYRWLTLHPDGRLETGVVRVHGLELEPDINSGGY